MIEMTNTSNQTTATTHYAQSTMQDCQPTTFNQSQPALNPAFAIERAAQLEDRQVRKSTAPHSTSQLDDKVLLALNERRLDRLEKRELQKQELQALTTQLKIYAVVQSNIHSKLSNTDSNQESQTYTPQNEGFSYADFNYQDEATFKQSPEYQYLLDHNISNHKDFLIQQGISVNKTSYQNTKEVKNLSDFSTSISDKSKLLNDDVQLKVTELNDTSSQLNATVEAMNKFVQKYHSILEQILRAF